MPKRKKISSDEVYDENTRKEDRRLYCICKSKDDTTRVMVQCELCSEWYHPQCVGLDDDEASDLGQWHCPGCVETMKHNPCLSSKGLLGFQGRVAPKEGWNDSFPVEDIDESVIFNNVMTKRHKVEGWNLFREGRITSLSSNTARNLIFFRSQCQAAMRQQSYTVYACFKNGGSKLKWATCSCPAGIDGQCKHLVATLYCVIDLFRQDIKQIPDVKTCTQKLQMWHVRKPITDDPLLFTDIAFVKHDPERPVKKDLACNVRNHNPVPAFAKTVTSDKLNKLVQIYDSSGIRLPILDTIRANKFCPVVPKQQCDADLYDDFFEFVSKGDIQFDARLILEEATPEVQRHYKNIISVDLQTSRFIEKNTRLQSKSSYWFEQRQYRLTSSTFGTFCRMREKTDPIKTFGDKRRVFTTKSVRHGINYEAAAFAKYLEERQCIDSCPVGLVVNPKMPFLAVSPDRLVKIDDQLRLVEVKCPFSVFEKKTKIRNQIKEKNFYLEMKENEVTLKQSHDYFYQIQGQMNLTGISQCDFVVFVPPDDIVIVNVKKDENFFNNNMLPKLTGTYFQHLLPHFVQELQSVHV